MFENLPEFVKVVEVGPRDGLQNEEKKIETASKIRLIEMLADSGLSHIEVSSLVSPKWIPQLADAVEVASGLALKGKVVTSLLVPNEKGYERFKSTKLDQVALFMSASQSHSKANINKSIEEAFQALEAVITPARRDGFALRCYVSVAFECPYEGPVAPDTVRGIVERLLSSGVDEISLGDTIGAATPDQVAFLIRLLKQDLPLSKLALHFHDTRGTALANVLAGLSEGVSIFDASIGGLGGCPYAPGAAGNLATEDLVYMLHSMGIDTGVDLDRLVDAGAYAQSIVGRELPGRYLQAALSRRAKGCPSLECDNKSMSKAVAVDERVVLVEKGDGLAWIKLNRLSVHNCLSREVLNSIIKAAFELACDPQVRVVAIIGAGAKVFCAGADLTERKTMTEGETLDYLALIQKTMKALESMPQPVIAAINGSAFGGGTELALACDLRVMMSGAQLRLTEVKLGIIPGAGGTQRLPRLIGKSKAKEMILTAAPLSAQAGLELGLIHRVVTDDGALDENGFMVPLMNEVKVWAQEIKKAAPLSLAQAKFAIDQGFDRDLESGLALETSCYLKLLNTRDRLEGLKAFAEKRDPEYKGE